MKYFKKIVGKKVYLSPMCIDDIETYVKWFNDFNVTDGLGSSLKVNNLINERNWLEENLKNSSPQFAIVTLENDELIGNCGFHDINHTKRIGTIGVFIGEEENRNKGYGTEVVNLLLDYGFNYMNLNNIMLSVYSFNEIAIATYIKVGFKEMGRRRKSYFLNGKYYDEIYMDILFDEFKGSYIENKNI